MQDQLIVIGGWKDAASRSLRLQNFVADGRSFIPIFPDEAAFKRQVKGSGFEGDGLVIDRIFLLSILRGDELLILNPGDPDPVRLTKADLAVGSNEDAEKTAIRHLDPPRRGSRSALLYTLRTTGDSSITYVR